MEAQSEYVHIANTFLHVWAPICMLSRCLLIKISASELTRKFIKVALLVGWAQCLVCKHTEEGGKALKRPSSLLAYKPVLLYYI